MTSNCKLQTAFYWHRSVKLVSQIVFGISPHNQTYYCVFGRSALRTGLYVSLVDDFLTCCEVYGLVPFLLEPATVHAAS